MYMVIKGLPSTKITKISRFHWFSITPHCLFKWVFMYTPGVAATLTGVAATLSGVVNH